MKLGGRESVPPITTTPAQMLFVKHNRAVSKTILPDLAENKVRKRKIRIISKGFPPIYREPATP